MSFIKVNDIFDELIAENKRLLNQLLFSKKCLNVLIEIKTNFNSIINELKTNLSSNQLKTIEDLEIKYKNIESEKQQIISNNEENNEINDKKLKTKIDLNSVKITQKLNEKKKIKLIVIKKFNKVLINEEKTQNVKNNSLNERLKTNDNSIESELTEESNSIQRH